MDTSSNSIAKAESKDCFQVDLKELPQFDFPVEFRDVYVDYAPLFMEESEDEEENEEADGHEDESEYDDELKNESKREGNFDERNNREAEDDVEDEDDCADEQARLLEKQDRHVAVVDVQRNYAFAIVSQDYEIVTNRQAVALAEKCFQAVFKLTDCSQMRLFNVNMPSTRSQCQIDFVHASSRSHIKDGDPWAPFIRVSNSFNRSRALRFDLGFCRGICRNGLIFGEESIKFKFSHSKGVENIAQARFELKGGEFAKQETRFMEQLANLNRFHVPRNLMWPLVAKTFRLTPPKSDAKPQTIANWEMQKAHVMDLTKLYFDQLEETGYAALNVLTDYATRPPAIAFGQLRMHGFQTTCGTWVKSFTEALKNERFSFKEYLGEYYTLVA